MLKVGYKPLAFRFRVRSFASWAIATSDNYFFSKVATTLDVRLTIELMLHLYHVKQISKQPIHLTHELIFFIQIAWERVNL